MIDHVAKPKVNIRLIVLARFLYDSKKLRLPQTYRIRTENKFHKLNSASKPLVFILIG